MKIMCKDQETKELLLKAIEEFPQSFGHIDVKNIYVFGPDTLDMMLDKSIPCTMVDHGTIRQLYDLEQVHAKIREGMDETMLAKLDRVWDETMGRHTCDPEADKQTERDGPRIVVLGAGSLGSRLLSGLDDAVEMKLVNRFMEQASFMHTNHSTDFGRDSGKKSRRPMVTSAKGHPYPLPKGPRGLPRTSRTRGR